jgi:hypothetical protein
VKVKMKEQSQGITTIICSRGIFRGFSRVTCPSSSEGALVSSCQELALSVKSYVLETLGKLLHFSKPQSLRQ